MDYEYFSTHYKLIAIDLSKQTELENSIGRLEQNSTIFFVIEKKKKPLLIFHKILWMFLSMYKNGSTKNYKSFRGA